MGLLLVTLASSSCFGSGSPARTSTEPSPADERTVAPDVDQANSPSPRTCDEVLLDAPQNDPVVRFGVGPVGIVAGTSLNRTYDNKLGWLYWFPFAVYSVATPDRALSVSARSVSSGAELLFEYDAQRRRAGPLLLSREEVTPMVSPTAYVSEFGVYEIAVTGDGGKLLGKRQIALCERSVTVLG